MNTNSNLAEAALWQMPNFVCIQDLNSKYLVCNKNFLKVSGYKTLDSILGTTDGDLKCEAAECAAIFREQDLEVIKNKPQIVLNIHKYADGIIRTFLTQKMPFKNNAGLIVGCIDQSTEINIPALTQLGLTALNLNKNNGKAKSSSILLLSNGHEKYKISKRESDCLFYLLRGKTVKEIAKILKLSPRTVEVYVSNVKLKLGCSSKSEVINRAIEEGLMATIPVGVLPNSLSRLIKLG